MNIPINRSYRLASDEHQWMIQRVRKYKGSEKFEAVAFYGTLESAIEGLRQRMVRESTAETLANALADMENASATLSRALTAHYRDDSAPVPPESV